MTYEEFIQTINSFTIRTDAPVSDFIRRAETFLRTVAKHYLSEKAVSLSVIDGEADLPSDFRELRAITGTKIYKPVSPVKATINKDEVGYYRQGNTLFFVGEADAEVGLLYASAFSDLTESQTNWLFDRFPNVYIAAVLKEFHRWKVNPEGVSIEQAALQEALAIVAEDDRRGRQTGAISVESASW